MLCEHKERLEKHVVHVAHQALQREHAMKHS